MKIEVEVISKETIKPSSPTPDHLRHHQLSFLDQIAPPVFMPLVLFYPADSDTNFTHVDKSDHLKKSLSHTLTRFYPLAGRVKDNLYVDCNDEGVPYFEARVKCKVSDVLSDPVPGELNKFHAYELDDINEFAAAFQVDFFDCGGMAIGLCISHEVADALSVVMFLNSRSALARGDCDFICPRFESAALFPPKDLSGFKPKTGILKANIVTKRFVFSASMIASLRDKYADSTNIENPRRPTRVEALSAFIWSRFMAATQVKKEPGKIYTVLHAVNLRTRMDPPLPEYYFGNISRLAIAVPDLESEEECYGLVSKMRNEITKINADYVRKLGQNEGHLNFIKARSEQITKGEVLSFSFTSLCRFPIYEADFGWGKPVWVGSACLTFKNLVTFFDTRTGNGIEAWVHLKEEDMAKLETDKDLLAYVYSK